MQDAPAAWVYIWRSQVSPNFALVSSANSRALSDVSHRTSLPDVAPTSFTSPLNVETPDALSWFVNKVLVLVVIPARVEIPDTF